MVRGELLKTGESLGRKGVTSALCCKTRNVKMKTLSAQLPELILKMYLHIQNSSISLLICHVGPFGHYSVCDISIQELGVFVGGGGKQCTCGTGVGLFLR